MKNKYEKWTGRTVNRDLFRDLFQLFLPVLAVGSYLDQIVLRFFDDVFLGYILSGQEFIDADAQD